MAIVQYCTTFQFEDASLRESSVATQHVGDWEATYTVIEVGKRMTYITTNAINFLGAAVKVVGDTFYFKVNSCEIVLTTN